MLKIQFLVRCSICLLLAVVVAGPATAVAADNANPAAEKRAKAMATLASDGAKADKALACKTLAVFGEKDAVPLLAALLPDEQLASWARIALEAIPDPSADAALRSAAGKLQGRLLVGVLNSIGVRRDAKAVEVLIAKLKDADAEVASAAAVALGRIGSEPAAAALQQSLAGPAAARNAVAEGCILVAEKLLKDGKQAEAAKVYELVRKADVPKQKIVEATRGAILAQQSAGIPLLIETLRSPDRAVFAIGLRAARELSGREATDALIAELGRAAPERQALLILALAERGDPAAVGTMLQAAKDGPVKVRVAAIRVLGRLGNASSVPVLLAAAKDANQELAETGTDALADLPGKDVDQDLAGRLSQAEGKDRLVLIQLAGRRMMPAAVPALLKAADDADAETRAAALTALGATIELRDLSVLMARVANPKNAEEGTAAEQALRTACERMPDREACAEKLVAAMVQASLPAKLAFLRTLAVVGGSRSVQAVGAAAKESNPEIQDTASRLLGEWMTVDAAPVLLDVVKNSSDSKYEVRALRGYIRLARQFVMPEEQRAEICRTALGVAKRDAERKLVLEALERHPSIDGLKVVAEVGKLPSMKNDAAAAAMVITRKLGGGSADVQKLLAQLGQQQVKVEIIKAEYGAGSTFKDVTQMLRKQARDLPLIVLPSANYNESFGGDPAPSVVKQLKIQYRINDKAGEVSFQENDTILLPMPK